MNDSAQPPAPQILTAEERDILLTADGHGREVKRATLAAVLSRALGAGSRQQPPALAGIYSVRNGPATLLDLYHGDEYTGLWQPNNEMGRILLAEICALLNEAGALRADRRRLDWLGAARNVGKVKILISGILACGEWQENLRSAVDTAMQASEKQEGGA